MHESESDANATSTVPEETTEVALPGLEETTVGFESARRADYHSHFELNNTKTSSDWSVGFHYQSCVFLRTTKHLTTHCSTMTPTPRESRPKSEDIHIYVLHIITRDSAIQK